MPGTAENRRFARIEYLAQVQLSRDTEVHIMSTRNISRGGVFIQGHPPEFPELRVGAQVELVIFDADRPGETDVALSALVVRIEMATRPGGLGGFGLQFVNLTKRNLNELERLITAHGGSAVPNR